MTLDAECPWSLPLVCGMPGAAAWVVAGWRASPRQGPRGLGASARDGRAPVVVFVGAFFLCSHACSGEGLMFEPAAVIAQTLAADAQQVLNQLAAEEPLTRGPGSSRHRRLVEVPTVHRL